jgi:hypothetical protein
MKRAAAVALVCLSGCAATVDRSGWSYVTVDGASHPSTCHVLRGKELVLQGNYNQDKAWARIPPGEAAALELKRCATGGYYQREEAAKKSIGACMREKGYAVLDEDVGYIADWSC